MTSRIANHWLPVTIFFGGNFLLHLLWENAQAPLYAGFESFRQHFWMCLEATKGDFFFMLTIYVALAVIHRNIFWVADRSAYAHPATWIITPLIGFLLALSSELRAVYVTEQWQYAKMMPLLPILRVGLTPVLQMLLIPLAVLFLTYRSSRLV